MRFVSRSLFSALAAVIVSTSFAADASAFCGFYVSGADQEMYNNATMVVMMREGTKTVLSMRNNYEGPPEDFAMVIPVPQVLKEENVLVLKDELFDRVDQLAAPRLVEYFEQDPCYQPEYDLELSMVEDAMPTSAGGRELRKRDLGVKVEAQFDVGEYNVVILSAKESNGLQTWLEQEKYNIPEGAAPVLAPYIEQGQYFFVARVDPKKVKFEKGQATLSPLRFHYESEDFALPVRLGLLNAKGPQDLLVHIVSRQGRYEVANYPNVAIPTNLIVSKDTRAKFAEFYVALFDYILQESKGAVVTEYAWDAASCDPCPTRPLDNGELMSLGADVLVGKPGETNVKLDQPLTSLGWTLTRLHARYTIDELKEDLVFRAAPGIVGGRGTPVGVEGTLHEEGAKPSSYNNFQGRYIMLNPWEGEIECESPQRGVWGGRPPQAAQDTAFAERGAVDLSAAIQQESLPTASLLPSGPDNYKVPKPPRIKARGCTCEQAPASTPSEYLLLGFIGLIGVGTSRRRRCR